MPQSVSVSAEGLAKAEAWLSSDRPAAACVHLVPAHVCDAVIAKWGSVDQTPIGPGRGAKAFAVLSASYHQKGSGVTDAAIKRLGDVFGLYCEADVREALAPGTGIAARHKFLPNEAELVAELNAARVRRLSLIGNARMHKIEAAKREAERVENEKLAAERGTQTEAERAAWVQSKLRPLKTFADAEFPPTQNRSAA